MPHDPQKLEAIFTEARARNDPTDRAAYLDNACAGDADLRQRVEALLHADVDAGSFLAEPAIPVLQPGEEATLGRNEPVSPGTRLRYVGDYELLAEIARGGMGVVYRARQVSLNRVVAVKMILAGEYAGDRERQRFKVEAEAAANLDHPNILPIYEVGDHGGHQYFSMKLIDGSSFLAPPRPPIRVLVATLARVCRAVHFAHQRGILHRDLKPGNILIDKDGTPFVTDFGVAKHTRPNPGQSPETEANAAAMPSTLTQSGAVVGTPSYMAPEQARGSRAIATSADVYSLGAILYEVLAGQPPFRASTILDTLLQVMEQEPAHPQSINAQADRDLSVVALKCLEKEPARRYGSAADLADDLERWLNGEPILARPVPAWEKGWKWARRRPAVAALLALSLLALVAGLVGLTLSNRLIANEQQQTKQALADRTAALLNAAQALENEKQAKSQTQTALDKVEEEQRRTKVALAAERRSAYISDIALAASEWAGNRPARAAQLLDACAPDLRGWEWHHLQRVAHAAEFEFPDVSRSTRLGGASPDGQLLLTTDSMVRIRDLATGKVLRSFLGHQFDVTAAAFSPDGKRVISSATESISIAGQAKGEVILWEADTLRPLRTLATDHKGATSFAFSRDGKHLALVTSDNLVRLWSSDGTKELHRWTINVADNNGIYPSVAFSPDGKHLTAGGTTLTTWDLEKKTEVRTVTGESGLIYSPDGTVSATIRGGNELVVRDSSGAEKLAQRIDAPLLMSLAFSPDGKKVAVGGMDGLFHVWEIASKTETLTIRGQQGWAIGVMFSPEGTRLLTSVGDPLVEALGDLLGRTASSAAIRVWDVARGQDYRLLPKGEKAFAAHPLRSEVAIVQGHEIVFYDPTTGQKLRSKTDAPEGIVALAYSPDGATLAISWAVPSKKGRELRPGVHESINVKAPHRLQLVDAMTGKPKAEPHAQEESMGAIAFSRDGSVLAATGWGKRFTLLDVGTGKQVASLDGAEGGATRLAVGPKAMMIRATTGSISWSDSEPERRFDGVIEVWDVASRQRIKTVSAGKGLCHAVAINEDGSLLAAAMGDHLAIVRLATGEQLTVPMAAHSLCFSPDGKRLAAATAWGVKLWDLDLLKGRDILTLGGKWSPNGNTSRVTFVPSASALVVNETDGLRVYDGRPWTAPQVVVQNQAPLREPQSEPPVDARPASVTAAIAQSIAAFEGKDPAAAALHALAALDADPEPQRHPMHRRRIALALQAIPKLRPVVPPGATAPSHFVPDLIAEPSASTANVCDPMVSWSDTMLVLRNADGTRFAVWRNHLDERDQQEAVKAGRSPHQVQVFEAHSGKKISSIDLGQRPSRVLAFSHDGKRVAAVFRAVVPKHDEDEPASGTLILRVWDAETGQRVGPDMPTIKKGDSLIELAFAAGDRLVIATTTQGFSSDRIQTVWDLDTGKLLQLPADTKDVYCQPGAAFLVTAGGMNNRSNTAHLREAKSLAVIGRPFAVSHVKAAASSADGSRVVLGNSYWLGAWDSKSGERLHPRFAVYGGARCVAITSDGSRYAAGFRDREDGARVRVWDALTGDALTPVMKLNDDYRSLRFSSDGRLLITVTETTIRLWDAQTGEPLTPALAGDGRYKFGSGHQEADALLRGDELWVRRTYETSQYDRWSLAPEERPSQELREMVEAVAGRRLDPRGGLVEIPAPELARRRERLLATNPDRFGTPVASPEEVLARRPDPRVKQLAARLLDLKRNPQWRGDAASAMGRLGDPSAQAALAQGLKDPEASVRSDVAQALGALKGRSTNTVKAQINALISEKDDNARSTMAYALHGASAQVASSYLLRLLNEDPALTVRAGAAFSLRSATPTPELLDGLRKAMKEGKSRRLRVEAAMSLAILVPDDKEAVPVLAAVIDSKDNGSINLAARYLYQLGPRAIPAIPAMIKLVEKGTYQAHSVDATWHAVQSLARLGPAARPAIPVLLSKLKEDRSDPNWYSSQTKYSPSDSNMFAYTLGQIGPEVVPDLERVIREDKDPHRRRAAVIALGFLGPPAKDAKPLLEAEAKVIAERDRKGKDDTLLAKAIEKALERIGNPAAIPVEQLLDR